MKTAGLWGTVLFLFFALNGCALWTAASAEEYFSLGMAYIELGRFDEAEKWFNRARMTDKTKIASEYNLGRIAFETGRYRDAAELFEGILKKDPRNVMALKAAAFSRIKTGELEKAEALYHQVLALVPESVDDGYNYGLVLFALEKYEEAEELFAGREAIMMEKPDILLLYARIQGARKKPEAADTYARYFDSGGTDVKARYEYAQLLEGLEHYARALEQYRETLNALPPDSVDPGKADIRFTIARLLLIADSGNPEGLTELRAAVSEGYNNPEALRELSQDSRLSAGDREELKSLIGEVEENRKSSETEVEGGADGADN
jgi:tetratricopeptide (TPR) repeat protein